MRGTLQKSNWPNIFFFMGLSFCLCVLLLKVFHIGNSKLIDQIMDTIEAIIEFSIIVLSVKIYVTLSQKDKKVFFWLILSAILLFFCDSTYYIANFFFNTVFLQGIVFYLLWDTFLIICLSKILVPRIFKFNSFLTVLLFFMGFNFIVMFLFFISKNQYLHLSSISMGLDFSAFYELILFDLSILCLVCSEYSGLQFFLLGVPIIISSAFLFNYSFIDQNEGLSAYADIIWFLGPVFMIYGLFIIKNERDFTIDICFRKTNTIKSRLIFWSFGISVGSFILFFIVAYLFKLINQVVFSGLPFFIISYSALVIALSIVMGKSFESPFKKIKNNIEALMIQNDKKKIDDDFSIEEFIFLQKYIVETYDLKEEKDKIKRKLGEVAAQVAHDIRSPLSAMNTCLQHLPQIPESQRIILRNAANRINDIANNLLEQYRAKGLDIKDNPEKLKVWLLAPIVDSIISEKRLQLEGHSIDLEMETTTEGFAAFSKINAQEMKRVLSNLINNAAEAFHNKAGKIMVFLGADDKKIFLQVKDNGCGIPKDKLDKVFKPGVTTKNKGSGLGLAHAKETIDVCDGTLTLESLEGYGTTVKITLPRAIAPKWFISKIVISPSRVIAILDDDQSVHDAWDQRLLEVSEDLKVLHFKTPADFKKWYAEMKEPVQVLSDYELLGEAESGLDVLEACKIEGAVMVTSHYENPDIIKRCEAIEAHLLPKNMLAYIPIVKAKETPKGMSQDKVDAVLIDDDPYNHEFWEYVADEKKKVIKCFVSKKAFLEVSSDISKDVPIYVDLNLKGESGLDVTKTLNEMGYKKLYIATGYADFEEKDYPYLSGVLGKEPPF